MGTFARRAALQSTSTYSLSLHLLSGDKLCDVVPRGSMFRFANCKSGLDRFIELNRASQLLQALGDADSVAAVAAYAAEANVCRMYFKKMHVAHLGEWVL